MDLPILDFAETMASLPLSIPSSSIDEEIRTEIYDWAQIIIVLDDDPTGTQTVHDIPIITDHSVDAIRAEVDRGTFLFYILTNSRALPKAGAIDLAEQIGQNIRLALDHTDKNFLLVIRGDSTLRGHFPYEDEALIKAVQAGYDHRPKGVRYLVPAFFEGGRYTINDIHYTRDNSRLIPVGQTAFAKDRSFGYHSSYLPAWIEEKSLEANNAGGVRVHTLSLEDLRTNPKRVENTLAHLREEEYCVVNAVDYHDLKKAILAILKFSFWPFFRTSASFIKALLGQKDRPLLKLKAKAGKGGLIIVGSHVPKSTAQLKHLLEHNELSSYEVDVRALLFKEPSLASRDLAQKIAEEYAAGKTCVLYTSREVVTTEGAEANLDIAATISAYLEEVVAALPSAPAFLLTKGGITSSRIATESLGVKRAMALGQVQPGVPTWELGPESKFPGLPFIIFPGNVGGEDSLSQILQTTII